MTKNTPKPGTSRSAAQKRKNSSPEPTRNRVNVISNSSSDEDELIHNVFTSTVRPVEKPEKGSDKVPEKPNKTTKKSDEPRYEKRTQNTKLLSDINDRQKANLAPLQSELKEIKNQNQRILRSIKTTLDPADVS